MSFTDDIGWLAVGGYYAIKDGLSSHSAKGKYNTVLGIVQAITNPELEKRVREVVYRATPEQYDEIWNHIEDFKRKNPHKLWEHGDSSFWNVVGKQRFPFTEHEMHKLTKGRSLRKEDEQMLTTYRGWTITLLMNTLGYYSNSEAHRVAGWQVYGRQQSPFNSVEFG